jgi:hypothetical protein
MLSAWNRCAALPSPHRHRAKQAPVQARGEQADAYPVLSCLSVCLPVAARRGLPSAERGRETLQAHARRDGIRRGKRAARSLLCSALLCSACPVPTGAFPFPSSSPLPPMRAFAALPWWPCQFHLPHTQQQCPPSAPGGNRDGQTARNAHGRG